MSSLSRSNSTGSVPYLDMSKLMFARDFDFGLNLNEMKTKTKQKLHTKTWNWTSYGNNQSKTPEF